MADNRFSVLNATLLLAAATCSVRADKISIPGLPAMSSSVLVADDTTPYTVTLTASGVAGYDDIRSVRILFNITESGSEPANGRGYLAWGQIDSDITSQGATWVFGDATGGGRWAYRTDAWGGTNYITPIGCSMSTGGDPTGGTGTRTVTFTFTVKPAWAANPLINDADAWAATARTGPNDTGYCKVGWVDNPADFVVVAAPCTGTAVTPLAPVISSPAASTLDVAVDPADSASDLFAIRISPPRPDADSPMMSYEYVQADGTIGGSPVWQTRAGWGTITVTGLSSSTAYTLRVCAFNNDVGICPSAWSAPAYAATLPRSHAIDCAGEGMGIHKGVHGMDAQSKMFNPIVTNYTLDVSWNTSMRAGGDGYDWKLRTAQWGSNRTSILEYLRYARDRNSYLQMLVNTRGTGTGNDNEWNNVWVSPLHHPGQPVPATDPVGDQSVRNGRQAVPHPPGEPAHSRHHRIDHQEDTRGLQRPDQPHQPQLQHGTRRLGGHRSHRPDRSFRLHNELRQRHVDHADLRSGQARRPDCRGPDQLDAYRLHGHRPR